MQADVARGALSRDARLQLPIPSVVHCGVLLFAVKMSLTVRGFARTLDWIRWHVQDVSHASPASLEAVRAVERAVAMAGALFPGRALCLEQSLVLYYLLRRQGVAARYRHGVQAYPFEAHAWVEYRGYPLNDVPEHVALFTPLPDQLP